MPIMVEDRSNGYVKMVPVFLPTIEELKRESDKLRDKIKFGVEPKDIVCKTRFGYDKHLRKTYGISIFQYEEMFFSQNGKCAICEQPPKPRKHLMVDHCHKSGKVRGLLCGQCNTGLGIFGDNIPRLASALHYLRSH